MATGAPIIANRENAHELETVNRRGPRTPEGKAAVSRNAVKHGLFFTRDFVRPDEQVEHDNLRAAILRDLSPEGAIERILAGEVFHAAWRLHRCSAVEARLSDEAGENSLDPMADAAKLPVQNAVDRARNQANRILQRALSELRRLQTERQIRIDSFPAGTSLAGSGLASYREINSSLIAQERGKLILRKVEKLDNLEALINRAHGLSTGQKITEPITEQIQSVPRNSLCTCGSGAKYKRCCGKNAPAVLTAAA